jgi:hypothetical protein
LYSLLIFGCKPFEIFWSHTFKIDQLNKNRHFTVPCLVHDSLHTLIFYNERYCFTLVDKTYGVVN